MLTYRIRIATYKNNAFNGQAFKISIKMGIKKISVHISLMEFVGLLFVIWPIEDAALNAKGILTNARKKK